MAQLQTVSTSGAPEAIGPYSQALICNGLVYCSGQIPLVPSTGQLRNANITEATEQVLANLKAVLHAAGCTPADVVKTTVYLLDLNEFQTVNELYAAFFGAHKPARATIQVAALPKAARIEIECIAALKQG